MKNELLQANKLIAQQKVKIEMLEAKVKELEANEIAFPLRLWLALEAILEKDFRPTTLTPIKVVNNIGENDTIEINPSEVICILPESKGRRKIIYLLMNEKIKTYFLNSNHLNFSLLCQQIDPLNRYLLKISKSAIVNAAYYELSKNKVVQLNYISNELKNVKQIKISPQNNCVQDFLKIKCRIEHNILLQKRVLGYKSSNIGTL